MADIVHRIPFEISSFGGSGVGGSYNLQDYMYDYAISGIPFLSATRDQWPYTEGMAEIRKEQFDSSAEPGEQSLYGWWLRSQNSFAGGAGVLYQDPDTQNPYVRAFDLRFSDSLGVDSWTAGQLKLLRTPVATVTGLVSNVNFAKGFVDPSGVDAMWFTDGTNLFKRTDAATSGVTVAATGTPLGFASFGTRYFFEFTDGVWSNVNTTAATKMYSPPAGTITTGTIGFAKDRLVAAFNNSIYFAPINTGATTSIVAAGIPSYTHTDPNWVWTSITEGPSAIYAAGHNNTTSSIFKFVVDTSSGVSTPTMTQTVTAVTPSGETIRDIYAYLGTFMGIATNKGFRVADFDQNGDVLYGPLLFMPTGGCQSIVGFDRFLWVGSTAAHDGGSGLFRVDLGAAIQEQSTNAVRYAYARDIYVSTDTTAAVGVTMFGATDRVAFITRQDTLFIQSATVLYMDGYLKTGRIRFNTEEPKLYKFVSLRTPTPLDGEVQFSLLDQGGGETPYVTYGPTFAPMSGDVGTPQPNGPQNWIALKFTLRRGTNTTKGGVLNGWQVKALPGSIRQRIIQQTFLLMDEESDRAGQRQGYDGWTRQRLEDFKAVARAGDVIVFQELAESISTLVVIDDWKYTQLGPPGPNNGALGGYLTVTMRTVAEST